MASARRLLRSSFARFLAGGVVTYGTTLLLMALWLRVFEIPNLPAYAVTHVVVLFVGFVVNRVWVFRARQGRKTSQGVRFVLANVLFRFVDWCVYSAIALLLSPAVFVNVAAANLIVLPLKYLWYRNQVFDVPRERTT